MSAESATLAWTVKQLGEEQHKEVVALKAEVRVPRTRALSSTSAALLTRSYQSISRPISIKSRSEVRRRSVKLSYASVKLSTK